MQRINLNPGKRKYLRVTFSNGSICDLPVDEIYRHYARLVIKQVLEIPIEPAIQKAKEHFTETPEALFDFASNGLNWVDVCLDVISYDKRFGCDRVREWPKAKKELIER